MSKFGFKCGGYAADIREEPVATTLIVTKPLLPKPSPLRHPPIHAIWQPLLLNEQKYRYFRAFCNKTVSSLSGFFDEPLVGRLVLQACELDPTICHAVIAIWVLDKTLDTTSQARYGMGSMQQRAEALDAEAHYKFCGAAICEGYQRQERLGGKGTSGPEQHTYRMSFGCVL